VKNSFLTGITKSQTSDGCQKCEREERRITNEHANGNDGSAEKYFSIAFNLHSMMVRIRWMDAKAVLPSLIQKKTIVSVLWAYRTKNKKSDNCGSWCVFVNDAITHAFVFSTNLRLDEAVLSRARMFCQHTRSMCL
jgi:hypothetical protein